MSKRNPLKKLHWLLIKTFVGPFLATFVVSVFLFLMQNLWKYLPDLIGKGIGFLVILEFISYLIPHVIPLALPLTILISSIMAFGNLGERYELVAIKSAGIGLVRMMMPLTLIMVLLSGVTFYSANVLIPKANLQWGSLLYDMVKKKPAMNLKDGVFFVGIDGYAIRAGKKHSDNATLEDVLIYSKADDNQTYNVIVAERGHMEYTDNERFLLLELYDGKQYMEMVNARDYHKTMPHNTMQFEKYFLAIDLSDLELSRTNPEAFKDDYRMLNIEELNHKLDSFDLLIAKRKMYMSGFMKPFFHFEEDTGSIEEYGYDTMELAPYYTTIGKFSDLEKDTASEEEPLDVDSTDSVIANQSGSRIAKIEERRLAGLSIRSKPEPQSLDEIASSKKVIELAIRNARNLHAEAEQGRDNIKSVSTTRAKYDIEKQRKYTLAFACILLFFVGAPLGAIIRRGGFGLPLVLAIVLFIIYHILNEIGGKIAREGVVEVWTGVWMSTFILIPVAIFLTIKANSDSRVFDMDSYVRFFNRIGSAFKSLTNKQ